MQLSTHEQALLNQALEFTESTKKLPTLSQSQFPTDLVIQLMACDKADLATIGCYLASRADASVDLNPLEYNAFAARNYARMLLARQSIDELLAVNRSIKFQDHARALAQRTAILSATFAVSQPNVLASNSLTLIIHGTWAATSPWWQPGGNFWQYIDGLVSDLYKGPAPFTWSGNNQHYDRMIAADDLVKWVNSNAPNYKLRIIAHSHGGNVCFLAAHLGLKIDKLILLGTPIRLEYLPDLVNINKVVNVYSTNDSVQTPPATIPNRRGEGRTLAENHVVTNYYADDDGNGYPPGHSELHEPGTWSASKLDAFL